MMSNRVYDFELARVLFDKGFTDRDIYRIVGNGTHRGNQRRFREHIQVWRKEGQTMPATSETTFKIPAGNMGKCDEWLRLEGDYALISDLHLPFHSPKVIEQWMATAVKHGLKRFIVVGDFFDGGQFHPKRGKNQHHARRFQDDAELAREVLAVMFQWFDSGVMLSGNHDAWFGAHMRGQVDPSWAMSHFYSEFADRLTWSDYEHADIVSGGKRIKAIHGANYSAANYLGVAQKLSAKYECGIVMGHQHHIATGWSLSGKHQCVVMGGAMDPSKLAYVNFAPRTNPIQMNSFAMLIDGKVIHYEVE